MRLAAAVFALALVLALAPGSASASTRDEQQPPAAKPAAAQKPPQDKAAKPPKGTPPPEAANAPAPPTGYVVGAEDVLMVLFWREKDMSAEVAVRPDGKITLPLLNDVDAAGLTVEQLRERIETEAAKLVEEPSVTIIVKAINSRKVFITGNVAKPGTYPLTSTMTVLQLIALAGGLNEYADEKGIAVMRTAGGKTQNFKFNYKDVSQGKKLEQNIELRPGDTVVVR